MGGGCISGSTVRGGQGWEHCEGRVGDCRKAVKAERWRGRGGRDKKERCIEAGRRASTPLP